MNTLDNKKIIIPNGVITGNVINNVTGNGTRRVDMIAGISCGDDMSTPRASRFRSHSVTCTSTRRVRDRSPDARGAGCFVLGILYRPARASVIGGPAGRPWHGGCGT